LLTPLTNNKQCLKFKTNQYNDLQSLSVIHAMFLRLMSVAALSGDAVADVVRVIEEMESATKAAKQAKPTAKRKK
jgi:hypothetical protein